jgi:osmoprotectant transport system ATP-binding protein
MVELKNVSKSFHSQKVLKTVNLNIKKGELMVLLGKSGSGKTTLLKIINRLVEHDEGEVLIDGQETNDMEVHELRRAIGYVIQNAGLFPHFTASENISVVPNLQKRDKKWTEQKAEDLLSMLNLRPKDYRNKYPDELSGGEQQRVGIARAFAGEPALLLMDEPFSALDPITRSKIRSDFKAIQRNKSITTCMVTHDIFEAVEMADRICLLNEGEIQQVGTPHDLIFYPANAYIRQFFDENRFQIELLATRLGDLASFLRVDDASENESLLYRLTHEKGDPTAELIAFRQYKESLTGNS